MRICFVDYVVEPTKPGRTGLSDVVWDMATVLIDLGHEVDIVASYHTNCYPDDRVKVHSFPTPPMGYRNVVGHFWMLKRAAEVARRLRPDIIHAPEYVSTAIFATLGVPAPLVFTVPGNVFHRIRYGHSYEWYYLQILKWAARTSAKHCAAVIAVSQEMKRWWEWTGSAPEKTHWIPYGVDRTRFHPLPGVRERLGLRQDCTFLLYVGRFSKEKGLLDLLNALSMIKPELDLTNVQVMLIGKGPQHDEVQDLIRHEELGGVVQVRSWVRQEDLAAYYSAADALLLPSHSEAFARVIPEALSCGVPVIGSKITGTEDHIRDGMTGFLFPVGDVQALGDILLRVVHNPDIVRCMRQASLEYVQKHLTWQRVVQRIVNEVYTPLLVTSTTVEGRTEKPGYL